MDFASIPTEYRGYMMRSRLEARWAVFFDQLDLKWEYESEGYRLLNGQLYIPDFWLRGLACYVEVKPDTDDPAKWGKAFEMARSQDYGVMCAEGLPHADDWWILLRRESHKGVIRVVRWHVIYRHDKGRFWFAGEAQVDPLNEELSEDLMDAISAAKQARFRVAR